MWADTYVESTSFDGTYGNVGDDTNVTFTSYQGGGTSAPALNGSCIRLYQKTGGGLGGYIVIGVPENHVITDIYITPNAVTKAGYMLTDTDPGSTTPNANSFVETDHECSNDIAYGVNDISSRYVIFGNFGDSNSNSTRRLDIKAIYVTYQSTGGGNTTTISVNPTSLSGFTYVEDNGPSNPQTISVSGSNLTANIGLALGDNSNYEMCQTEDGTYTNSLTLTHSDGSVEATNIYVRLKSDLAIAANYAGTITLTSTGVTDATVTLSGSVTGQLYAVNVATGLTGGSIEANSTSAAEGATISLTAHPDAAYTFGSWSVYKHGDPSTTVTVENNQFTMPDYEVDVTASFNAKPTHTATFSVNGEISSNTYYEGQTITFPANPATIDGKSFVGWVTDAIVGITNTAPSFVTSATMGNSDVTYYAVFANVTPGTQTTVTDELTRETTGVAKGSTTYANWSGVTGTSGAVYAGNSAGDKDAIQLRTNSNNSGIVTTASGGYVTKVKVTWNSNTGARVLDIYGKNSAYNIFASELYGEFNGDLLGSLYYNYRVNSTDEETTTTTELTFDIDEEIEYIGLRSHDGAIYLDKVEITWTTGTPETYSDYCTTVAELVENTITGINDSYTIDLANQEHELDLSGAIATSGATVQFEVANTEMHGYCSLTDGVLNVWRNGIIYIRAYVNSDATYNAAEKIVTVTVVDNPVICYEGETETTPFGTNYTVDEYYIEGGPASLQSSNTNIATVSGLVITPVAVGSVTITINTAATDIWHAGSATFTLDITAPEGSVTAPSPLFNETFDGFVENSNNEITRGGNDNGTGTVDVWSNTAGASEFQPENCDESNWTVTKGGAGYMCAKFGTSDEAGSATTRSITVENGKTYKLTFKAAPWSFDETKMIVTATGATVSGISTDKMEDWQWNDYAATVTATSESITLTFAADNNRFFLDEVKLVPDDYGTTTVTLNKYGYATYCSQNSIDFSKTTGCTAWRISSIDASGNITFTKITETIKGGQGVLLYNKDADGVNTSSATLTFADGDVEFNKGEAGTNLLVGTTAPLYIAADTYYGLSGSNFVNVNAGTIPAGKALLPVSAIPSEARELNFVFEDEVTALTLVNSEKRTVNNEFYDLQGRKVANPTKGLYIVNGKKVIIK